MIWYPYEQLKTMKAPYEIVDANGVYLYTKDQKLIDYVQETVGMAAIGKVYQEHMIIAYGGGV